MGLINDISEKIVPRTQQLIAVQGLDMKQALMIAFEEAGYIKEDTEEEKNYERN